MKQKTISIEIAVTLREHMKSRLQIALSALIAVTSMCVLPGIAGAQPLVAYTRSTSDDSSHDIWVTRADGSGRRRLTSDGKSLSPAWTPDGKRILFVVGKSEPALGGEIWIMNRDGSGKRQLTRISNWGCESPAVSPNGKQIVFVGLKQLPEGEAPEPQSLIRVMNIDGSSLRTLNIEKGWIPSFVQGGSAIFYQEGGQEAPAGNLNIFSPSNRRKRLLYGRGKQKSFYDGESGAALSPDAKRIALTSFGWWDDDNQRLDQKRAGIVLMSSNGTGAKLILQGQFRNPSWSSDGSKLIFANEYSIQTLDVKTRKRHVLLREKGLGDPVFQPASQRRTTRLR
jgi:Tol biopolymer transport system component